MQRGEVLHDAVVVFWVGIGKCGEQSGAELIRALYDRRGIEIHWQYAQLGVEALCGACQCVDSGVFGPARFGEVVSADSTPPVVERNISGGEAHKRHEKAAKRVARTPVESVGSQAGGVQHNTRIVPHSVDCAIRDGRIIVQNGVICTDRVPVEIGIAIDMGRRMRNVLVGLREVWWVRFVGCSHWSSGMCGRSGLCRERFIVWSGDESRTQP